MSGMAMNEPHRFFQGEADPDALRLPLGVFTIVAAGIVYYFTRHPLLAALLPWLHGGWNTFRSGLWILKTDPLRPRAWTCFAFYLTMACWKAAAAAVATLAVFGFAALHFGIRVDEKELIATTIAFLAGVILHSVIGIIGVAAALRCRVRVWVQSNLRRALRGDLAQASRMGRVIRPHPLRSRAVTYQTNLGVILVVTAMMVPVTIVAATVLVLAVTLGRPSNIEMIIALILFWCGLIAAILSCGWLSSRVVARSPRECWPPGTC
jgi:hypothetical protein